MGIFSFKKPKKSSVRQSYWGSSKVPKVPVWKQRNDDDRLGVDKDLVKGIQDDAWKKERGWERKPNHESWENEPTLEKRQKALNKQREREEMSGE